MSNPTLTIRELTIALPKGADRECAVQNVNIELQPGKVTCLIGESGSGKSLVARSILGLLPGSVSVAGGSIMFDGMDLTRLKEAQLRGIRGRRIAMIFQDPMTALNPLQTIGRQIGEALRIHTNLDRAARRERTLKLLESVHLSDTHRLYGSYPHQISGGQRQRVVIAMALALEPQLLIADEPTTALDVTTQAQILKLILELQRERNTAVLFITHDFGVVADIADTVVVMRKGELVESGPAPEILKAPRHSYTKALLDAVPKLQAPSVKPARDTPVILEGSRLRKTFPGQGLLARRSKLALNDVSVQLKRGETLGIVGESGSGKSTLARAFMRLVDIDQGDIQLSGQNIARLSRRQMRPIRKRIQMVFQDPYSSLDPRQCIGDAIAEGPIAHGVSPIEAREEALKLLGLVGLDMRAANRFPHEFSGGQRQRVGIARALALQPEILIADEPLASLDVSVQAEVLALLTRLRSQFELSIILVTHDLRVALQVCDRIAVMRHGEIVELATAEAIFAGPEHAYTRDLFAAIPGMRGHGHGDVTGGP